MTGLQIIAAVGGLVAIVGAGATYTNYIDDKNYDVSVANVTHEQFRLAQSVQLIQMQVIAKESRLADIDAELSNIAYRAQVGKSYATDAQRKQQLLDQRRAIIQRLEILK
ncbi:MAG: hypothetical protein BMS9Abin10_1093 [Gammaproteobacteria bacterium]|nr:MAG: hypothetical protein BMS9Abin10_1093 [Gammaproteobacteria bacterium]